MTENQELPTEGEFQEPAYEQDEFTPPEGATQESALAPQTNLGPGGPWLSHETAAPQYQGEMRPEEETSPAVESPVEVLPVEDLLAASPPNEGAPPA